jgi:hypothetical protein
VGTMTPDWEKEREKDKMQMKDRDNFFISNGLVVFISNVSMPFRMVCPILYYVKNKVNVLFEIGYFH